MVDKKIYESTLVLRKSASMEETDRRLRTLGAMLERHCLRRFISEGPRELLISVTGEDQ